VSTTRSVPDLDALPADCAALFEASRDNFFATVAWWRTMLAAGMPPGAEPRFLLCTDDGNPAVLMPLQLLDGGRTLQSLTNPYTCLYQPLIAPGLGEAALRRAGTGFGRFCRGWPTVRLDALAEDSFPLAPLLAGARGAGMLASRFAHFGNWYEPIAGRSWEQYLAARPGALRETVRRKLRRAQATLEIVATPNAVAAGIDAYEDIYARSWKVPEPYPRFHAEMMRRAAAIGVLRLGLLRAGGRVVAAQIWIVLGGRAAVLKLAHDEADRALSPGTVLTALMIRELIGREGVAELDFGRGDDPYKQLWATRRRQRIGIVLANPLRPGGLAVLGRQLLGRVRRRLVARP
jgi:CelD/BcsL family acetyltransferase involved in cellulose biosynthesis